MANHYNRYPLKHFAATVADCMGLALPEPYAPPINWVSRILKDRLGGTADRAVLYHADAVGLYIWQKYPHLFAPVYQHTSLNLPFCSTVSSFTPVAHASMYTGMDPDGHGIHTYTRPKLTCSTLFDELLKAGKRPCILATNDSTFEHIFAGRDMDYFKASCAAEIQEKALELIASDKYDVISIHTFDYDDASHAFGPESKQALNALALEAEGFHRLAEALEQFRGQHRILMTYSPDHGQHSTKSDDAEEVHVDTIDLSGFVGLHGSKMIEDMNILHFFGTI